MNCNESKGNFEGHSRRNSDWTSVTNADGGGPGDEKRNQPNASSNEVKVTR